MRKNIVAGNWKMNTTVPEGVELAKAVVEKSAQVPESVGLIIATPFTHLVPVADVVKGTKVELSAENCADKEKGAYTGEVSAAMLASAGCKYTILGHSERRQYYGETDATLVEKVKLALANGLGVIFCVGENLEQREAGKHFEVVTSQIENVLFGLSAEEMAKIIVAYEPVWAIGTGKTATADQAEEVCKAIRELIAELYDKEAADKFVVQYGGSMNAKNADELLGKEDVDGGLIGGASLKAPDFAAIVKAASK